MSDGDWDWLEDELARRRAHAADVRIAQERAEQQARRLQEREDQRRAERRDRDDCPHDVLYWTRHETRNGLFQVRAECTNCGERSPLGGLNVSHETARSHGVEVEGLPTTHAPQWKTEPCERCGNERSELHHWAPRHLFDDADWWPQSYLCRDCHKHWHRVMTPAMNRRKAS